jgi:hypothetical protein
VPAVSPIGNARLCHEAGGELDRIQFLLGHVGVKTTERRGPSAVAELQFHIYDFLNYCTA